MSTLDGPYLFQWNGCDRGTGYVRGLSTGRMPPQERGMYFLGLQSHNNSYKLDDDYHFGEEYERNYWYHRSWMLPLKIKRVL